ncbi:MAG: carboxypeptidase-like regulatory domain-containing protein [Planctomycetota bacterium]
MMPLIRRYIVFALSGTFAMILFYGIYQMTSGPKLYEGDRMEERACRLCRGSDKGCDACGYDGKVDVIIPGPNHQTTVYGEVFEKNVRHPARGGYYDEGYDDAPSFQPGRALQEATAGAIDNALVVFTSQTGERTEKTTPFTGKFTIILPAGTYKVTVEKSGFQKWEKDLVIPLATAELWQWEIPDVIAEQVLVDDMARQNLGAPDVMTLEIGMTK